MKQMIQTHRFGCFFVLGNFLLLLGLKEISFPVVLFHLSVKNFAFEVGIEV